MNKNVQKVLSFFYEKPYALQMGANLIASRRQCSPEEVKEAKRLYYKNIQVKNKREVNILLLDIETAPLRAYVWSRWKQNIFLDQSISEWFMLTWSAKWLNEEEVFSDKLTPHEVHREDDARISKSLWKLLEEADIVIGHNSKRFDIPKINSRFIINGLPPTSPYKQIDTMEVAKRQFGFSSNKLDNLAIQFGFERKLSTGFELWKKCMEGDKASLAYMEEYNKYDVVLLEKVYLKLRPYIKGHPNLGVYYYDVEVPQCGHCGSASLILNNKYYTNVSEYTTYRCTECGAVSRTRVNINTKNKRKNLLTTIT